MVSNAEIAQVLDAIQQLKIASVEGAASTKAEITFVRKDVERLQVSHDELYATIHGERNDGGIQDDVTALKTQMESVLRDTDSVRKAVWGIVTLVGGAFLLALAQMAAPQVFGTTEEPGVLQEMVVSSSEGP